MHKEILTKLGMAVYLHRRLIKQAQQAKSAVEYLSSKGVFSGMVVRKRPVRAQG